MFSQDLYVKAIGFAARAHGEQKTPLGLPYVVHLSSVAMEVIAGLRETPGRDEDLAVACALLHDVVEDTPVSLDDIADAFGAAIATGVAALTKSRALFKADAMRDSLDRIRAQPAEIWMVKLGDRITNLAPPPPHWTPEKIESYRTEARLIADLLAGASAPMAVRLRERIRGYPHT